MIYLPYSIPLLEAMEARIWALHRAHGPYYARAMEMQALKASNLWKRRARCWGHYCAWLPYSKRYANRLVRMAEVPVDLVKAVPDLEFVPRHPRHCEALLRARPEDRLRVWRQIRDEGGRVTVRRIQAAIRNIPLEHEPLYTQSRIRGSDHPAPHTEHG